MNDTPITEPQQHWLDHIQATKAFDGSIADYARSEGLNVHLHPILTRDLHRIITRQTGGKLSNYHEIRSISRTS